MKQPIQLDAAALAEESAMEVKEKKAGMHATAALDVSMQAIRLEAEKNIYEVFMQAPVAIAIFSGADYIIDLINDYYLALVSAERDQLLGKPAFQSISTDDDALFKAILDKVRMTGEHMEQHHKEIKYKKGDQMALGYFNIIYQPLKEEASGVNKVMVVVTDVTEQHLAAAELARSRTREQNILEGISDGLIAYDFNWNVIYINQKIKDLSGIDPNTLVNKNIWEAYPELVDTPQYLKMQEAMTRRKTVEYEYFSHIVGKWLEIRIYPTAEGISVFATDISARRKTEDALRSTKEQLELTFRNVPAGIYLLDKTGALLFLNDNAARRMGYANADEALMNQDAPGDRKKRFEQFDMFTDDGQPLPPEQLPPVVTFRTRQPVETVIRIIHKETGAERWFLTKSSPLLDEQGELSMVLVTSAEITEQKATETAIRQSEKMFRTLAETLPQMVWMTDAKGAYEYASPQWNLCTGLDPMAPSTWEKLVHPDDMAGVAKAWSASLGTGQDYCTELRLKNIQGEYRWHVAEGKPLRDEQGKILKWIGAFADIHDRKTIEEKLEKLVAERTAALERSNESLQQFAHVASHDLKEPVRKIKIFSGRLKEELQPLNEKASLYLQKVHSATDRMYAMIDGVLTYSTFNAAQQNTEKVDLNKIIHDIVSDVEVSIQQKGADVRCGNLPVVEGAQVLLYQLFYNLINNALKFSRLGVEPRIFISSQQVDPSHIEISVRDNGIGFEQAMAEKIFSPFARLHPKEKYEGTGLGLSLCKKIVERHQGTITANGALQQGATFTILLPLQQGLKLV